MNKSPTPLQEDRLDAAHADVDRRLTDLEIKLSFSEDLIDHLNTLVTRQQQQLEYLLREIRQLQAQRADENQPGFRSMRDELPPHY